MSAAFIFVVLAQGHCQAAAPWRDYNEAEGFPASSFRSVTVAESGAIMAVSSAPFRACIFDGYEAKSLPLPEGAARIYQSPSGQLWTPSAQGLWCMRDDKWTLYPLADLAATPSANQIPLCPIRLNVVLCLLPDRLIECNAKEADHFRVQTLRGATDGKIGRFSGMTVGVEDELWVIGERGMARLSGTKRSVTPSSQWREFIPPESLHLRHLEHPQPDENGVTLVAESSEDGQSRVVRFDGEQWQAQAFGAAHLTFAWRGPEHSYWACSANHLFHGDGTDFAVAAELSPRQYYDVAIDWRGTFWLATSAGLVRFTPGLWRAAPQEERNTGAMRALAAAGQWTATVGQNPRFDMDPENMAVIKSSQGGTLLKPIGLLRDGRVCYSTLPDKNSNQRNRLATFDGTNFQTLPFTVPQPAAAANLYCFLETQSGDLWLGGDFGVAWLHGRWTVFTPAGGGVPEGVCHVIELPAGQIWCASPKAIWSFDGKNWLLVRAGFYHLSAILGARDGGVWVGGDTGITHFFKGDWIENGVEEGLGGGAIRALCEDPHGSIWAAASNSVEVFHPEADTEPPRTFIAPMSERERNIPENGMIVVKFGGRDRWNITSSRRLLFSYRLDTGEWSPFNDTGTVSFNELSPGRHYFQVRAMNRAGNIDPNPAKLDFAIVLPLYTESRLILIALAGAAAAGFLANLAYRRHRALVLSYAQVEKQVAERTRQLEAANQELLQSQKMRALGTLAAGIAHDFNNILSIIKGSAQIIEGNLDNPAKIRTRADRIKTVVDQGSAVVQAMLGFTRGSDEMLEACDINEVVDNTIKLLGDRFLRDVELQFDRAPSLPRIRASQSLIQQILLNFIFNASEAMEGRKRVVITTARASALPAQMALQPGAAAGYVTVAVRDFGCGIPPAHMARVFDPFFTTKALSTRRGTGLGLSIVYELASKMNAGLALESTVGQGSVFSMYLPLYSEGSTRPTA